MFRMTDVVRGLVILNIGFFVATLIFGTVPMHNLLALHLPESPLFKPLQIATHFFMHGGWLHIFFNMFLLIMFGSMIEAAWGARRFLVYYFACALGAAVLHVGVTYMQVQPVQQEAIEIAQEFEDNPSAEAYYQIFEEIGISFVNLAQRSPEQADYARKYRAAGRALENSEIGAVSDASWVIRNLPNNTIMSIGMLGASGAIFGILLAFGMLFPNRELIIFPIFIPIKAKYLVVGYMALELFLGIQNFEGDNIAHFAHLGGALTGFLLILYWRKFGTSL